MEVIVTAGGAVLDVRLDRPEKRNAITVAMYAALADAFERAAADPAILVVTIAGRGGMFTSGNDLRDFQQARAAGPDMPVFRFLRAIASCPKIVVAGVAGPAVGIGTTMLLHCDLVVAATNALFSLPFVDLALVPEAASSLLLPRLIGRQRAAKHLILAEPFDAETAFSYGIVTEIAAEEEIEERLRLIAERIAAKPPEAVQMTKRLLLSPGGSVGERIAEEGRLFEERLRSAEAAEAFAAFFEKRPPDFARRD
ncbi:MAG TPA: enoyl-CoA hydratase-related protein [Allosphingosinicella sp.]|nr:enoyl-CoA hydratase-related protein [Allosphingosinicella sp.]